MHRQFPDGIAGNSAKDQLEIGIFPPEKGFPGLGNGIPPRGNRFPRLEIGILPRGNRFHRLRIGIFPGDNGFRKRLEGPATCCTPVCGLQKWIVRSIKEAFSGDILTVWQ